ncbi:ASCH domain-containing protein [Actinokineospora inagensis]|uniref:ASCH domain-containing protein n=1 Tax=Actinokineospora inagensis TaxID=103730 RepID=UPI00042652EF|nr:ASCH domain-containing protein [Actinokineospora inagensis]
MTTTNGEHTGDRPRPLLISVHPRFAEAILDGTKTVELRRTRVAAPEGSLIVLYATAPVMAVVGSVTLAKRHTASPSTIWRRHRQHMNLTRAEFNDYLTGATTATALILESPQRLNQAFPLATLREHGPFSPPQSYRYIAPTDPDALHELVS